MVCLTHKLVYKMEDSNENVDVSTRFRNLILENTNNLANENKNDTGEELMDDEYFNISDLPNVLIITNVPEVVFDHDGAKVSFSNNITQNGLSVLQVFICWLIYVAKILYSNSLNRYFFLWTKPARLRISKASDVQE